GAGAGATASWAPIPWTAGSASTRTISRFMRARSRRIWPRGGNRAEGGSGGLEVDGDADRGAVGRGGLPHDGAPRDGRSRAQPIHRRRGSISRGSDRRGGGPPDAADLDRAGRDGADDAAPHDGCGDAHWHADGAGPSGPGERGGGDQDPTQLGPQL